MSGRLDILPLGDRALTVEVADQVSEEAAFRARRLAERVMAARLTGVREVVPAFCSLTVHYDPLALRGEASPLEALRVRLEALLSGLEEEAPSPGQQVDIPVCYGGDYGEDLAALALAHEMAPAQLVALHTAPVYFVGMVGLRAGLPLSVGAGPSTRHAATRNTAAARAQRQRGHRRRAHRHLSVGVAGRLAPDRPHPAEPVRSASQSAQPPAGGRPRPLRADLARRFRARAAEGRSA